MSERPCMRCGGSFNVKPSSKQKYCGPACARASRIGVSCNKRHGLTHTPEHRAWKHMRNRCTNPKCADYPKYGGRGIKIADRWDIFENFLADMGQRPSPSHSIERVNNDLGYGPDNCKWGTKQEQSSNRRPWSEWNYKDGRNRPSCSVTSTECRPPRFPDAISSEPPENAQ